ncbi:hypothetical protein ACQPXH_08530 [Nocardia sp. CA-135953]|uniref:hypothetical protein n=1 Tax=Nocardia sp. CA-135953 TaxID=3239978 RepID=UPI003D9A0A0A
MQHTALLASVVGTIAVTGCSTTVTESAIIAPAAATEGVTKYPVTVENCGKSYTFTETPKRVVVMNGGSIGEVSSLVALGVADRADLHAADPTTHRILCAGGAERNRNALVVKQIRQTTMRCVTHDAQIRQPLVQIPQGDRARHPGPAGAGTGVHTAAERQVVLGIRAVDRSPHRRVEAQQLLDRAGPAFRIGTQQFQPVRTLVQQHRRWTAVRPDQPVSDRWPASARASVAAAAGTARVTGAHPTVVAAGLIPWQQT